MIKNLKNSSIFESERLTDEDAIIVRDEKSPLNIIVGPERIKDTLRKTIFGQDEALDMISLLISNFLAKSEPVRPLTLFLYGPTGTGKTETARKIQLSIPLWSDGKVSYGLIRVDLNQYNQSFYGSRLTGSPPGYVGYNDQSIFDPIVENPHQIIIFDEIEKSHPDIIKMLMQAMDEGRLSSQKRLTDGSMAYNTSRCIFIFTSNIILNENCKTSFGFLPEKAGDVLPLEKFDVLKEEKGAAFLSKKIFQQNKFAVNALIKQKFPPEIVSRFDGFVEFAKLDHQILQDIISKFIRETAEEYQMHIASISLAIIDELIRQIDSKEINAREIRLLIESSLGLFFGQESQQYSGKVVSLQGRLDQISVVINSDLNDFSNIVTEAEN
jgi:ATP-dependent Clp protease ATP-binding subunit ClpA